MQYILTEQEYKALLDKCENIKGKSRVDLQKACTLAAMHMPIKFYPNEEAQPWGCILNEPSNGYCDECPVQDICPNEDKEWSK